MTDAREISEYQLHNARVNVARPQAANAISVASQRVSLALIDAELSRRSSQDVQQGGDAQERILSEVRSACSYSYRVGNGLPQNRNTESLYADSEAYAIRYVDAREDRLRALSTPAASQPVQAPEVAHVIDDLISAAKEYAEFPGSTLAHCRMYDLRDRAISALQSREGGRDAARYRWLKTRINWREIRNGLGMFETPQRWWTHVDVRGVADRPGSESIDEYIDSAMSQGQPQGGGTNKDGKISP
jgi:hypothetical protein